MLFVFMKKQIYFLILLFATLWFSSCASRKDIVYVQDIPDHDTIYAKLENQLQRTVLFRAGDKVLINVTTRNKELSEMFNQVSPQGGRGGNEYTLNEMGEIDFPYLGKVRLAGLDRMQTEEYLKQKLIESSLIKEPYVSVQYSNVGFYTLGQLGGRFVPFSQDQTTILEALALAGDLDINSLRKNLLVIRRNVDGTESTYRLDMTSREKLVASPAYYVQQNDIIYAEPNYKTIQASTINGTQFSTYTFYISIFSTTLSLYLLIKGLVK